MGKEYYVYEWIRLDNNEPFYVGKGKGDRWRKLTRGSNRHFNNIVNSIPVAVNILEAELDEDTAYEYEIFYINEYRNMGFKMSNISDGGSDVGCSTTYLSENNYYRKTPKGERYGEKPVVCINYYNDFTQKEYKSLSIAEDEFPNINISKCCNKIYKKAGKTKSGDWAVWIWKDEYDTLNEKERYHLVKEANKNKIICLNDNNIFNSSMEASKYYDIDNSCINKICAKKKSNVKGLIFSYFYDEYNYDLIKTIKYSPQSISVKCVESGEVFNSMGEAERFYNLKRCSITDQISGRSYQNGIYSNVVNNWLHFTKINQYYMKGER